MKKRLLLTVLLGVTLVLLFWSQTGVVKAQFEAYEYADAKSLTQAVELCKQKLVEDGHEEYAPLISEQTVRAAIRSAIRSYESGLANSEEGEYSFGRSEEYFRNVVKPKYMQIAEEGRWPEGCYFKSVYKRVDPIIATVNGEKIRIDLEQRSGFPVVFEKFTAPPVLVYDGFGLSLKVRFPDSELQTFSLPIVDLYYGHTDSQEAS